MHLCARIGVHHETCPPFVKVPVRAAYTITKATIDAQLHDAVEWRIGRYAIVEPGVRGNQVCATARAEHDGDGLGLVAAAWPTAAPASTSTPLRACRRTPGATAPSRPTRTRRARVPGNR